MTDLKALLDRAADDTGTPLTTDFRELLGRAQRDSRHRRTRVGIATVGGLAALTIALPVALPRLLESATPDQRVAAPASGTPSGTATTVSPPAGTLTDDEIIQRCLNQIQAYNDIPRWKDGASRPSLPTLTASQVFVSYGFRTNYQVGDVVALDTTSEAIGPNRLCLIPSEGHEKDPVPLSTFSPAATDTAMVAQVCSEANRSYDQTGAVLDMRGARIVAHGGEDGVSSFVLEKDGVRSGCLLAPLAGKPNAQLEAWGPLASTTTVSVTTGWHGTRADGFGDAYYGAAGLAPEGATVLRVEERHTPVFDVPVTEGAYAFNAMMGAGADAGVDARFQFLAADGSVIHDSGFPPPDITCPPTADHGC